MALLGNLIKYGLEFSAAFQKREVNIVDAQREVLRSLIVQGQSTAFGTYHGFSRIAGMSDPREVYAREVPITDYHTFNDRWWKQQQKLPNITWPGHPSFFANSSGTTGKKSKRIPVTQDLLNSMRKVGIDLILNLRQFNLPESVFQSEVFVLSSSADLNEHEYGFVEGEISGINVHNFPDWYDFFYRPGKEIATINNWDERLAQIVKSAPEWNVGSMAGIPSWILVVLKAIMKKHGLQTIHEIWPNLSVYSTGGVAFEPYRESFERITASPLTIIDTYLASEGFFGYRANPDTMDMKLAIEHGIYYEFIPFDDRGFESNGNLLKQPEVHRWEDLEEEQDYALIITTCAGAWRYMIGDTIQFTDIANANFRITGRTKFFLNVVGSQLSEEKINQAIEQLSSELNIPISEFCVAALKDAEGEYFHQWVLASEKSISSNDITTQLDNLLKQLNKNYRVARDKALKGIQVKCTSKEKFYNWLETQKKKGGQVKTPKVMDEEQMHDLLQFLKDQ